jgi:hypothetical protein
MELDENYSSTVRKVRISKESFDIKSKGKFRKYAV